MSSNGAQKDFVGEYARAFNVGCDARLRGDPRSSNPYDTFGNHGIHDAWARGWEDVNFHWGSARILFAAPLPPVRAALMA